MRTTILLASAVLLAALPLAAMGDEAPAATQPAAVQPATQPAAFSRAQLDNLVAPIALFPDTLVTQILYAAAHPGDIPGALKWTQDHPNATDAEVEQQGWHPSIKALVRVPSVLQTMNDNPAWTQDLGVAFTQQRSDVMSSIARLRKAAQGAVAAVPAQPAEAVQQAQPSMSQQQTYVPQVTPVYQPAVTATYSSVVPIYPLYPVFGYPFGYPYSLATGPTVVVVGGGGGGGTTIIQNGLIGGAVGPINGGSPTVSPFVNSGVPARANGTPGITSTSIGAFGYNPAVANSRRGNVSPFVNVPAAPAQTTVVQPTTGGSTPARRGR